MTLTNMVATTEAVDALYSAVDALHDAIGEVAENTALDTFEIADNLPTVAAALADVGWSLAAAQKWTPDLLPALSSREVALLESQARSVTDPWDALTGLDVPRMVDDAWQEVRRALIEHADLAREMPARGGQRPTGSGSKPKWLIRDMLAARKRHLLAGTHGSAKTTLWMSMLAASLKGTALLGRDVPPLRWLVISGEQTADEMEELFRAHGLTDEHLESVHWTTREAGVSLGTDTWNAWFAREADVFRPDVIVLDTVGMVCQDVAVRDNDAVRRLFRDVLTPVVDRHDAALLALTHMRKGGGRGDEGVLGAQDWTAQSDQVVTVGPTGPLKITKNDDGTLTTSRPFAMRRTKTRVIADTAPEHYVVAGAVDADGTTTALSVDHPLVAPTTVERIVAALDAPLGRGALADAVKLHGTGTKFREALALATDSGLITKNDDNLYERVTA
jgi:hypothetical protein